MSNALNILFVTPFLPYSKIPHAGGQEIYYFIKLLSQKHKVFLLPIVSSIQIEHCKDIERFCHIIGILKGGNKNSFFEHIFRILSFRKTIKYLSKKYEIDVIQIEYTNLGKYFPRRLSIPAILDAHDIRFKTLYRRYKQTDSYFQRIIQFLYYQKIKYQEIYRCKRFDMVFTRSGYDEGLLKKYKGIHVKVIAHPVGIGMNWKKHTIKNREEHMILFIGAMDRDLNIEAALFFAEKVMTLIIREYPDARFTIVGNNPPECLWKLDRRNQHITVTGFVEELEPYYTQCSVFVSPLFVGGGIIVKNLDAMAAGLPVITTAIGNEGIGAEPGKQILIAETAEEFASKVIGLFENRAYADLLGREAYKFVNANYGWNQILHKLEKEYRVLVNRANNKRCQ